MIKILRILKFIITLPFRIVIGTIKALTIKNIIGYAKSVANILSFVVLLLSYLLMSSVVNLTASKYCPNFLGVIITKPVSRLYDLVVTLNRYNESSINRVNLIELAIRNMKFKKSRTFITIGGMSIGIAAIIFLVSIGYGLEKTVTSRVARLDEMRQADVVTQPGSNVTISDKTLSDFKELGNIDHVLPLIALVGKVNYNNSVADMAVYGVTSEYLKASAVKPVRGEVFTSNELSAALPTNISAAQDEQGKVAGAKTTSEFGSYKQILGQTDFSIFPDEWIKVRKEPSLTSPIIGYTKRVEGKQTGYVVWGNAFADGKNGRSGTDDNNNSLGKWINSKYTLWEKVGSQYNVIKNVDSESQLQAEGYIAWLDTIKSTAFYPAESLGKVLGESTSEFEIETTDEDKLAAANLEDVISETIDKAEESTKTTGFDNFVEINGEVVYLEESSDEDKTRRVPLTENAYKEAVVNRAMLKILGLDENNSIGAMFDVSFIVPSTLADNPNEKVESIPESYKIVAVVPQDDAPFFYVPFIDLRGLGISKYSQLKLVATDKKVLPDLRKKVEAMGFVTSSVTDTVEQINRLFTTARTVLALIGTVALAVAALGMFNTLTVSLLERIREIGLMKAMGMKSYEVKELFLTESMIMGFFGGILGIGIGYLAGKLVSLILTLVAIRSGVGVIDVSYVPPSIILVVLLLSIFVGLVTGLYPAKRATDISALNALRYE